MSVKRTLLAIMAIVMLSQAGIGQVAVDLGFGSQSAKIYTTKEYNRYYSLSPSLRYQASAIIIKVGMRQSLGAKADFGGYELIEDGNGNYGWDRATTIKATFRERGFGFGVGMTFSGSESLTRPYLMFEYYSMKHSFVFENPSQEIALSNELGDYSPYSNNLTPINGKSYTAATAQFRFTGGFQFALGQHLTLFNEASINMNNTNQFYGINFSIDLGLRFFIPGTNK